MEIMQKETSDMIKLDRHYKMMLKSQREELEKEYAIKLEAHQRDLD